MSVSWSVHQFVPKRLFLLINLEVQAWKGQDLVLIKEVLVFEDLFWKAPPVPMMDGEGVMGKADGGALILKIGVE